MPSESSIVIGIVQDLDDPEHLGRVRVRFPHLNGELSDWTRVASPMAGKNRGFFMRPEKDDEVLVAWEHSDARRSYIVGSLWSKADLPPSDDGRKIQNNWRFFRSRSGHLLKFDDTDGAERIEIVGKGDRHKLVIDVSGGKIEIRCDTGDVAITAPSGKLQIDAGNVEIRASASMTLQAGGVLNVKGATVNIN